MWPGSHRGQLWCRWRPRIMLYVFRTSQFKSINLALKTETCFLLKWLFKYGYSTLTGIYILQAATFNKCNSNYFPDKNSLEYNRRLRNRDKLTIPQPNNEMNKRNMYFTSIKIYNHLPRKMRSLKLKSFKNVLKRTLFLWFKRILWTNSILLINLKHPFQSDAIVSQF